jgi:hypothetical protein
MWKDARRIEREMEEEEVESLSSLDLSSFTTFTGPPPDRSPPPAW